MRDLAALNALPSMCVGRTPDETLDIVMDALPTVLSCPFVHLALPGGRVRSFGEALRDEGALFCLEADVPIGQERGRLVVGRTTEPDEEIDRVLVRSAANIVGTTLETANVLDAARRKDEFLAMLGHELRNPLAPILTAVELLARNPSAARERQVIARHTRHLARLVDDLLDISRVTRGHVDLRSERVTLASVLERAVEICAPLMSRNHHELQVADASGVTLEGDAVRLAQVFGNILTNAAKFTPSGGKISVDVTRAAAHRVCVSIRDNGRGLERDQLARVFEPFVQVDRGVHVLGGGLGLGLAIVKNLVESHGGKVSAESDGRGKGCTFRVELPIVDGAAEDTAVASSAEEPRRRSGVRVLVVDDNADVAELLSEALEQEGYETTVAYDGRSALERFREVLPHAAVLDVGLPELDGYEVARALRAEHGAKPTLIAATGYGQRRDRLLAQEAGFDCHFVKPVSVHDLVRVLDERL